MALMKKNKETREEKQERKDQKILEKYGLEYMSDPVDADSLRKISNQLMGTGFLDAGLKLSLGTKPEESLKVSYLRALVEQNFIIIRQLDRISAALDKE
jgi:hypothetical protein